MIGRLATAQRHDSATRACLDFRQSMSTELARTVGEQLALAGVAGERRGALEFATRLARPAELGQEVAAHARQQVIARQRIDQAMSGQTRLPAPRPSRPRRRG